VTRYLLGRRAGGKLPCNLQVVDKPPFFHKPKSKEPEHVMWPGSNFGWRARRGLVHEWHDDGAAVIARVFPEEYAVDLAHLEGNIVVAKHALEEAQRARQEFLDSVAARAAPVRLAAAKREREAFAAALKASKEGT
jgi:hypothetical protein